MNRAALPIAITSLLTLAAPARAVMLSPHGLGQVLFYPYYTVNKGQDTLLSLTNTDFVNAKVVKLRVREGINGRAVADLDVFLAPGDVWAASITATSDDGGALLRTSDASCTMPEIPASGLALSSGGYDGSFGGIPADDGPHGITRTREGYIEVIASGDLPPNTATYADVTPEGEIEIDPGTGTPPNCAGLAASQIAADASAPTPTLFGTGAIVNVGDGIYYGYAADALSDFTATPLYGTDGSPALDQANTGAIGNVRANVVTDVAGVVTADFDLGIDAVSAVLMRSNLSNEWLADPSLGALTDWVLTFPTKSWYVDKVLYPSNPTTPFSEPFSEGNSAQQLLAMISDRAGGKMPQVQCADPPIPECLRLRPSADFSVCVFSFRDAPDNESEVPSDVLGSRLVATNAPSASLAPWGAAGWASLDLATGDGGHFLSLGIDEVAGTDVLLNGLPAIGFMAYDIVNAQANPGLLANYGATFPHRSGGVRCETCVSAPNGASR